MENIKFRAWDGKKMLLPDDIGGFVIADLNNGMWIDVMLFTGCRDKNGKEIFEGDLLQVPNTYFMAEGTHRVHYYKDGFVTSPVLFTDLNTANKNNLSALNKISIVIGNIYEK